MSNKYDIYMIYDDPVPYENLKIYPVKMRRYLQFLTLAQVILLDKNSIPDIDIISMSYLEYVFFASTDENLYMAYLDGLLRIVLHLNDGEEIKYYKDKKGKPYINIGDVILDSKNFDEIRDIVIAQNLLNPPDDMIQKSLRESIAEANELRRKMSGNKTAGIEDQMVSLSISTSMTMEDVYDLTIRKFTKMLERVDHKIHYEIYLAASMSGFVTFKDKSAIKHWLSDLSKDGLSNMVEYDEFEQSVSGAVGTQ